MVTRKGRLPREHRIGRSAASDALASSALRLRREHSLTEVRGRAPAMEYTNIEAERARIIAAGQAIEQKGAQTEQEIITGEQALRQRVLPPEPDEPYEPSEPSIIDQLPAHIPEPPKIEERIAPLIEKGAAAVTGGVTRVAGAAREFARKEKLAERFKTVVARGKQTEYAKAVGLHEV